MTIVARRFSSTPVRTATETWNAVCELLLIRDSYGANEIRNVTGLASMLISEEYSSKFPIVFSGSGPQVRIYTLHEEDALDSERVIEDALAFDPNSPNWKLSLPCDELDIGAASDYCSRYLHISVRVLGELPFSTERSVPSSDIKIPTLDVRELGRS